MSISIPLPYGRQKIQLTLPDTALVDVYQPQNVPPAVDPKREVRAALDQWLRAQPPLQRNQRVAIAINDKTRPVPHEHILPPLLEMLAESGIQPEAVQFLIATGTHTPMTVDEFDLVLPGDILSSYRVASHNCDDLNHLVELGVTKYGTPVSINETFLDADLRIVVGNIEPHHFMGFSGGVKTAGIGLASRQTINVNHQLLMDPRSRIGSYDDNPIRQDLEEIGTFFDVHLALNVVLNGQKQIVKAFAGSPLDVMKAAIPVAQKICQTPVKQQYDLVVASAGGYPKDINFYQAQKAITHASLLTRDGGVIILVAACEEGSGSTGYEQFMSDVTSHQQVFEKTRQLGFRIGPHKAFQVARDAVRVQLILLSDLPAELAQRLLLTPTYSVEEALALASTYLPARPEIAVLPKATSTIPYLDNTIR